MSETAFYDIHLQRGIDRSIPFSFFEGGDFDCGCAPSEEKPVDLSRKSALLVIRSPVSKEEIDRLSTENGRIEVTDQNTLTVRFPHAVTQGYAQKKLVFDLVLIDSNNQGEEMRDCVLTGQVLLSDGVAYAV